MINEKIISFGIPRSGSTLVWQVLNELFDNVQKTHDYIETKNNVVCTYRDFRDVYLSLKRTGKENHFVGFTDLKTALKYRIDCLEKYTNNPNVLFLQYEKFVNDWDFLFKETSRFFNIEVLNKKEIKNKFNIEKNKERQMLFNDFKQYDKQTQIHGNHIYKGEVGGWKTELSKQEQTMLNKEFKIQLIKWGYICHPI